MYQTKNKVFNTPAFRALRFPGELYSPFVNPSFRGDGFSRPTVNIRKSDSGFFVDLAAPGLTREDFNIRLEKNVMIVSSSKSEEVMREGETYTSREFRYGSFSRSFTIPETVNKELISASYEAGVLTVSLPLLKEENPEVRTIQIN